MAIQRSYTGGGAGIQIQPLDRLARSQERMSDFITKAEELKFKTFKENEKFVLDQKIDPKLFVSQKHAEIQDQLLTGYNDEAAKIIKTAGGFGNLTSADKLMLNQKRQEIEIAQAKMLADQQRWALDEKTALAKPDYYDVPKLYERGQELFTKGTYSEAPLPIRAKDVSTSLREEASKMRMQYSAPALKTEGGIQFKGSRSQNFNPSNPKEVDDWIVGRILSDPQKQVGLIEEFSKEPIDVQLKYLDDDNSGTVDERERSILLGTAVGRGNPLLKYAVENKKYKDAALVYDDSNWQEIRKPSTGTSFDWNLNIGAGHNKNNEYDVAEATQPTYYGSHTFTDLMNLGSINQTPTEAQPIDEVIDYTGVSPIRKKVADSVRFNIIGYSPKEDVMIVKIADDGEVFSAGDVVSLPAEKYDNLLKRKPIGIDRASFNKSTTTTGGTETPADRLRKLASEGKPK